MLLGDVIARLTDETTAAETILGLDDLQLIASLRAHAEKNGVGMGAYAAWAVRTYADNASSEEWTTLVGALGRSDDPGLTCLKRAFTYVLAGATTPEADASQDD